MFRLSHLLHLSLRLALFLPLGGRGLGPGSLGAPSGSIGYVSVRSYPPLLQWWTCCWLDVEGGVRSLDGTTACGSGSNDAGVGARGGKSGLRIGAKQGCCRFISVWVYGEGDILF